VNGSPWLMPLLALDAMVTAAVAVVGFILAGSMIADVVEDAAVRTGARSEGLLYSAGILLNKFTAGIGVLVTGVLLNIVHFPVHALKGTVGAATMNHLVILYVPINAAFSFASIFVLLLYRIDRPTHERNLATLAQSAALAEGTLAAGEDASVPPAPVIGGPQLVRPPAGGS
ncbi:MAG: MFS transporter, partial [Caulobacteraceae bacterium]